MTPRSPLEELAEIEREMRERHSIKMLRNVPELNEAKKREYIEATDDTIAAWQTRLAAARGALAEERTAFNVNDSVLVRLRPRGRAAFDAFYRGLGLSPTDYIAHCEQPDGRLRMQLWEVMQMFGPSIHMGSDPPFETRIEWLRRGAGPTEERKENHE